MTDCKKYGCNDRSVVCFVFLKICMNTFTSSPLRSTSSRKAAKITVTIDSTRILTRDGVFPKGILLMVLAIMNPSV